MSLAEIEAVETFLAHQAGRGLSLKTIRRRRGTLLQFLSANGELPWMEVTSEVVETWVHGFATPATRNAYRSDLMAFYVWAVRRKVVEVNPVLETSGIRVPKTLPRPVAPSLLPAVLESAIPETRLMIGLAAYAGLRVAELAALTRDDLDILSESPTLAVRCGKGGKDRIVPIHPDLIPLLRSLPPGRVFAVNAQTIGSRIATHLRSLGIEATAHKLRHSFGTELARSTAGNVVLVAKLMGHESIQTTMRYIGWAGGAGAEAIASMYPDMRPAAAKIDELAARRARRA